MCVMVRSGEWGGMASMGGAGETRGGECVCDGEEWGGMASMGGSGEARGGGGGERECVCVMVKSGEEWLPWEDLVKQGEGESVCVDLCSLPRPCLGC